MSLYITDNQAVLPLPISDPLWNITTVDNTYSGIILISNQMNRVSQLQYNISGLGQNVTFVYVLSLDQSECSTLGSSTSESTTLGYNGSTTGFTTVLYTNTSTMSSTLSTISNTTVATSTTESSTLAFNGTITELTTAPSTTTSLNTTLATTAYGTTAPIPSTLPKTTMLQNTSTLGTTTFTSITNTTMPTTATVTNGSTTTFKTTPFTLQPNTTLPTTTVTTTTLLPNTTVTTSTLTTTFTTTSIPNSTVSSTITVVPVANSTTSLSQTTSFPSTITDNSSTTEEWTGSSSSLGVTTTEPFTASSTALGTTRITHHDFNHTVLPTRTASSTSSTSTSATTSTTTTTLRSTTPLDCTMCPVGCLSLVVVNPATRMVTAPPELFYMEKKKSFTGILVFAIVEATFIVLLIAVLLFLRFSPFGRRYLHLLIGEDRREVRGDLERGIPIDQGGQRKDHVHVRVSGSGGYEVPRSVLNKTGRMEDDGQQKQAKKDYAVATQHNKKRAPRPPSNPPPSIPHYLRERLESVIEKGESEPKEISENAQKSTNASVFNELQRQGVPSTTEFEEPIRNAVLADTESPIVPTKETVQNVKSSHDCEPGEKLHSGGIRPSEGFIAIPMEEDIVGPTDPPVVLSIAIPVPKEEETRPFISSDCHKHEKEDSTEKCNPGTSSSPREEKVPVLTPAEDGVDYFSDWVNLIKERSPYVVSWTLGLGPVVSRNIGTGTEEMEDDYSSTVAEQDPNEYEPQFGSPTTPASRPLSWPLEQKKETDFSVSWSKRETTENSYEEIPYGSESDIVETMPPPLHQSPHRRVPTLIDFYESGKLRRPDNLYEHERKPTAPPSPSISFSIGNTEVILVSPNDGLSTRQEEASPVALSELIGFEEGGESCLTEVPSEEKKDLKNNAAPAEERSTTDPDKDDDESVFIEVPSEEDLAIETKTETEGSSENTVDKDEEGSVFVEISEDRGQIPAEESISEFLRTFGQAPSYDGTFEVITNPFDSSEPTSSAESQINLASDCCAITKNSPDVYEEEEEQTFWPGGFDWSGYFESN